MGNWFLFLGVGCLITHLAIRFYPRKPKREQSEIEVEAVLTSLQKMARMGACQMGAYQTADQRIQALKKMVRLAPQDPITRAQLHWSSENDWTGSVKEYAMTTLLASL